MNEPVETKKPPILEFRYCPTCRMHRMHWFGCCLACGSDQTREAIKAFDWDKLLDERRNHDQK